MPDALTVVLADLEPLLAPGRVLMIGEWLGTQEFPALITALVDRAADRSLDVIVGLEIPMTEDVNQGTFGSFWSRAEAYRDGRSSEAMASLVTALAARRLDVDRPALEIVSMDGPWVAPGSPVPLDLIGHLERPRDQTMAERLLEAMDRMPKACTIVLAGSVHTRSVRVPQPTLGAIVRSWHPRTVSLVGQTNGGEAWVLTTGDAPSGAYPVPAVDLEPGAMWTPEPGPDGHNGYLNIGTVTPSPPADTA